METRIKVLSTVSGQGGTKHDVRLLVNGTTVKYATIDSGTYDGDWTKKDRVETIPLPTLATGDWTWVAIGKGPITGLPFVKGYDQHVPGFLHIEAWHETRIEYVDLQKVRQIPIAKEDRKEDRMHLVRHPTLDDAPVLMKIAESARHLAHVHNETATYRAIEGTGIGPEFLGHVMEGGRVVGFLAEWVEGAGIAHWKDDRERCAGALARLHARGIAHGDVHRRNFLVKEDRVYVIDFERSRSCWDQEEFDRELEYVLEWEPAPASHSW